MTAETNVTPLRPDIPLPGQRGEQLVEFLRVILARAERGEIKCLAAVYERGNGGITTCWGGEHQGTQLLGLTAALHSHAIAAFNALDEVEVRDPEPPGTAA